MYVIYVYIYVKIDIYIYIYVANKYMIYACETKYIIQYEYISKYNPSWCPHPCSHSYSNGTPACHACTSQGRAVKGKIKGHLFGTQTN